MDEAFARRTQSRISCFPRLASFFLRMPAGLG
jgi:hypothetical protein